MKKIWVYILIGLLISQASANEVYLNLDGENLTKEESRILEKSALIDGDSGAAEKLANQTALIKMNADGIRQSDIWLYVGVILGSDKAFETLRKHVKEDWKKKDVSTLFLSYSDKIESLKNNDELLSDYILAFYYIYAGQPSDASFYSSKLTNLGLFHKLNLTLWIFEDELVKPKTFAFGATSFLLPDPKIDELTKRAFFNADHNAALKLADHYGFVSFSLKEEKVPYYYKDIWMHIARVLDGSNNVLSGSLSNQSDVFLKIENTINNLKKKDDVFSVYALHKYYLAKGDGVNAAKYEKLLLEKRITSSLIYERNVIDDSGNIKNVFVLKYKVLSGGDLFDSLLCKCEGFDKPHGAYLIGEIMVDLSNKEASKYSGVPLKIIFYKDKNCYYNATYNIYSLENQKYFIVYLGAEEPEKYLPLHYEIIPLGQKQ